MSETELYLRTLGEDGRALLDAARQDPDAPVAACPDWTVHKLVGHMGRIHTWAAEVVRTRTLERISSRAYSEGPDDPAARIEWAAERHAELLDALGGLDGDEPVWNFVDNAVKPGRFWHRRQAMETGLHRWDAQLATGEPQPIDADLAVAGLGEVLDMFLPRMTKNATQVSTTASMHVHCTDRDGEWLVRFGPEGAVTTREHAKGDLAIRGSGSDLYLLLWNRIGHERLEVFGDTALLDRWKDSVRI
jgi:uncharacterized protein (TIGR03083 family)